jgi:phosphodiesterase/alkaline phosphatase D-like protein
MGTINPHDTPTSYWFWYGISPQNMYHTPGQIGLTGKNDIQVSADLISLAPNTTYYYRLSANNVKGSVQGEDKTFKTAVITKAPIVITGPSRDVTASSATIGGTINPNGMATTYYFDYGLTPAFGGKVPLTPQSAGSGTSPVSVTTSLAGLKANTTYYYRLVAVNSDGTSNGANMTLQTSSATLIKVPASSTIRK